MSQNTILPNASLINLTGTIILSLTTFAGTSIDFFTPLIVANESLGLILSILFPLVTVAVFVLSSQLTLYPNSAKTALKGTKVLLY